MLRSDADDHVVGLRVPREQVVHLLGQRDFAERQAHTDVGQRGREEVHRRRADEPRDEQVGRAVVQLLRCADLLGHAGKQHHHPIPQCHGLGLVVRDVYGGGAQPILQPGDLRAHLHAQLGVQVRQWLVHQERLGIAHDGAPHRHPLPLAAGQLGGLAIQKVGQVKDFRGLLDLLTRSRPSSPWPASAGRRCSAGRSCAGRARRTGTPSRCRGPWAPSR